MLTPSGRASSRVGVAGNMRMDGSPDGDRSAFQRVHLAGRQSTALDFVERDGNVPDRSVGRGEGDAGVVV